MLQAEARVKALEREKQELTWQLSKIKEEMEELRWVGGLSLSSKIKHWSCGKKTSVGAFQGCCGSGCGFEDATVALPLAPAP